MADSLYDRLGGYDAITAVVNDFIPRMQADAQVGRFWAHRGADGVEREKQLLIDFLCTSAGGPLYYTGRDMVTSHRGMKISGSDFDILLQHLTATLEKFEVPETEKSDVLGFIASTKGDIVEA